MAARAMVLDVLVRLKDNLSGGLGRLQGRLRGLADMGRKIGLVGTAIAGISFMGPIQEAAAFQQQLIDMAATADLSGRAAFDFAAKSGAKYEELALKTRLLSRDIAAGAGQMLASNLDPAYIEAVIGDTAKAAKAANAELRRRYCARYAWQLPRRRTFRSPPAR